MPVPKRQLMALVVATFLLPACNEVQTLKTTVKSDWEAPAGPDGLRAYVVDWACEPKQFGNAAEKRISGQDEYCEWRTEKVTATEKICRFTSSFDKGRDFYLNSRHQTQFNSTEAARTLVEDCNRIAVSRLNANQPAGNLCSGVTDGCLAKRNSDPEICDKIRFVAAEKHGKRLDFCIDQLASTEGMSTPAPLLVFGILTALPDNCVFATDDHTEVTCTIPLADECFSVTGQLRPGLRVLTQPITPSTLALPKRDACYVP